MPLNNGNLITKKHWLKSRYVLEIAKEGDVKKLGYEEGSGDIESITNAAGHVNFFQNLENGEKLEEVSIFLSIKKLYKKIL